MKKLTIVFGLALALATMGRSADAQNFSLIHFGGDICSTSAWNSQAICKINGTSVPVNSAADQTILTTSSTTGAWKSLPSCTDTGGNHLNYDTSTHVFSCGVSGATAGTVTTSGSPASGNLAKFSGSTSVTNGDLSGDCTTSGTLATTCLKTNGSTFATIATSGSASDLSSGTIPAARLPNPSASTLGGIESFSAVSHNWINTISTSGVPSGSRPACADLSDSTASCSTDTTSATNISSGTLSASRLPSNTKIRSFGTTFGDTAGSALTSGSVVYFTVPYSCTISAWNATVDAGTVTFDIWKIATGTAIPTVTNTITAAALPAISTGTAKHSTTLTAWTTSVTANDIIGIQLNTVATAKFAELDVECDQ
jgi:hypothetical protein